MLKVQNDILLPMDNQEVTLLVLLDLSAAFDMIEHSILLNVHERDFGVSGTALKCFDSFQTDRKQRVLICGKASDDFIRRCGVPQGSCMGPVLFTLYVSRLFHTISHHLPSAHSYADDTQLYFSFRPMSLESQVEAIKVLESCIVEVRSWFISNRLMISDIKTEFLIIGSSHLLAKMTIDSILIGESSIKPLGSVRNLVSWFDDEMRMNIHLGKTCSKAFYGLYKLRQIRKFLSVNTTKTLVHAFVSSHLDYCHALLFSLPKYQLDRLQFRKSRTQQLELFFNCLSSTT